MFGKLKVLIKGERKQTDPAECIFCNKTFSNQQPIHYEDEKYFVITDINQATSVKHLLVVTKEHILNALTVKDPSIINQMKQIGEKVLNGMCDKMKIENRQFRFGFHLPPFNSIDHLHLHCFIQPIQSFKFNRIFYGFFLNSVEAVMQKLANQQK